MSEQPHYPLHETLPAELPCLRKFILEVQTDSQRDLSHQDHETSEEVAPSAGGATIWECAVTACKSECEIRLIDERVTVTEWYTPPQACREYLQLDQIERGTAS